jgi:dipeptidyl aminopeptidase/acylaminoacyl peptidase
MQRSYARLSILMLIALMLLANAACAGNSPPILPSQTRPTAATSQTAQPTQPAMETSVPTDAPTAEQPSPTAEQPSPTIEQPSPTIEQPAAQGEILVFVDQSVLAGVAQDGTVRPFDVPKLDKQTFQLVSSRDGSWLAGPTDELWQAVTIYNVKTGESQVFENHGGTVGSFIFSPDGTQLLFLVKNMNTGSWQLKTIGLASGESAVVLESAGDPAYQPLAWTPRGILVTEVYVLAADAVPSALHVLDPQTGRLETALPEGDPYIMAEVSRDGSKLAIVKGAYGLGMENPTPALVILDMETGETTEVEPAAPGFIYDVRWSPGGARLIYARTRGDGSPPGYTIAGAAGGTPMIVDLSAAPGTVKDVAWDTDDTLLVLLAEGGEEKLYHLPATSTDASALRELAAIDSAGEDRGSTILTVGR